MTLMLRKKFGAKNLSEKNFYDWFSFQDTVKRTHNNNINSNNNNNYYYYNNEMSKRRHTKDGP